MQKERTYVMVKHDGVQRSLVGEIIKRFEQAGLKLVGMKMFVPDMDRAKKHYGKDNAWCIRKGENQIKNLQAAGIEPTKTALEYGRDIEQTVLKYITTGPVVGMVIEGHQAMAIVKKLAGTTEPLTSDVGTIRGDYMTDSYKLANMNGRAVRNIIHITDPEDPAGTNEFEINLWFTPGELLEYRHINEAILYDVNVDGVLE